MLRINNYSQFLKLFESQVFDFDRYRDQIFKYIDAVKNKDKDENAYENRLGIGNGFIYLIITNQTGMDDSEGQEIFIRNGFMKIGDNFQEYLRKSQDKWSSFFGHNFFRTYYDDGKLFYIDESKGASGWAQKNYNPNKFKRESKYTLNFYITIEKNSSNVNKFLSNLTDLDKDFIKLSNDYKTPLAWKVIKSSLLEFLKHNDSLKVFNYRADQKLKSQIEKTVLDWCKRNDIKISPRTHTHGADEKGLSYGQKLADIIDKRFQEVIVKNGNGVSNQKYFEILKRLIPEQIKAINIKF